MSANIEVDDAFINDELYEKLQQDRANCEALRDKYEWKIIYNKMRSKGKAKPDTKTVDTKTVVNKTDIIIKQVALIPGITKKNATALIKKYKSLQNIIYVSKTYDKVEDVEMKTLLKRINDFYYDNKNENNQNKKNKENEQKQDEQKQDEENDILEDSITKDVVVKVV